MKRKGIAQCNLIKRIKSALQCFENEHTTHGIPNPMGFAVTKSMDHDIDIQSKFMKRDRKKIAVFISRGGISRASHIERSNGISLLMKKGKLIFPCRAVGADAMNEDDEIAIAF